MLSLRPIKQGDAFEFIRLHHRHHGVPVGALWWDAVQDDAGTVVGVSIVGRPVARQLDDGLTVEVTRLCVLDDQPNACSMLYGAARAVAIRRGYRRGLTYILDSEDGGSLRASGWEYLWQSRGGSWSCPSRPRIDKAPTCPKHAYGWGAWPQLAQEAA